MPLPHRNESKFQGHEVLDDGSCAKLERASVLGFAIDKVTKASMPAIFENLITQGGGRLITPVNIDIINKALDTPELAKFLHDSDVVYADGAGVVWGSVLMGDSLPRRVTSIALLWYLSERWQKGQHSMYFLGGPAGVAEQARDAIVRRFPGARIVGCHRGHLSTPELVEEALSDIERTKPDILLVGFGSPVQELFIRSHWDRLSKVPVIWPVGALTSHIAELRPRAPRLFRKLGFEWVWRLFLEPGRLWRRYLIGNPVFLWRVLRMRLGGNRMRQDRELGQQ